MSTPPTATNHRTSNALSATPSFQRQDEVDLCLIADDPLLQDLMCFQPSLSSIDLTTMKPSSNQQPLNGQQQSMMRQYRDEAFYVEQRQPNDIGYQQMMMMQQTQQQQPGQQQVQQELPRGQQQQNQPQGQPTEQRTVCFGQEAAEANKERKNDDETTTAQPTMFHDISYTDILTAYPQLVTLKNKLESEWFQLELSAMENNKDGRPAELCREFAAKKKRDAAQIGKRINGLMAVMEKMEQQTDNHSQEENVI